jgi:hypothetical protein
MGYKNQVEILKNYPNIHSLIYDVNKNQWWDRDEDAVLSIFMKDKKFIKEIRAEKIKLVLGDTDELSERKFLKEFILNIFEIMKE